MKEAARRFLVLPQPLCGWFRDARAAEPKLTEPDVPANRVSDLTRYVVHELKNQHLDWGSRRIAMTLTRMGLRVSRSSVVRILRERPPRGDPRRGRRQPSARGRPVEAERPNDFWQMDHTKIESRFFGILYVMAVLDLFSRKILVLQLLRRRPKSADALRGRAHRGGPRLWLALPLGPLRRRAGRFVRYYNRHRPNWGLADAVPNERYYRRRHRPTLRRRGELAVTFFENDRDLPVYSLRAA